jgi:MFS family permease
MRIARFGALRHRDFRLYWIGHVISVSGQHMLWMVQPWLIYEISGSKVFLGVNALAQAIPATALVLIGGAIADKFDQRKLLIGVQASYIVLLSALVVLALTEILSVWHIFVISFLHSGFSSFESPARQSMFTHLVDRKDMPNAVAMNSAIHPGTRILAPVLGGLILALVFDATGSARIAGGAVLTVTTAGVAVYALMLLRVHMPAVKRSRGGSVVADMTAGANFIWRNRIFASLITMAYYNMVFGISLSVMFPIIAKDILEVGPFWLSMMYTAMGAGSVVGVLLVASLAEPRFQRRLILGGSVSLGISIVLFAISTVYVLSLALLFVLGIGVSAFNVAVQANLQMLVPNDFRGRVMGIWSIVHTSFRPVGEMQLSGIAAAVSAPFALALSGTMVIAFAFLYSAPNRDLRRLVDLREAAADEAKARPHVEAGPTD